MKIYNNVSLPEGLGNESFDPREVYESGYTLGYESGMTDGLASCPYLEASPESISFPARGGESVINVSSNMPWSVDVDNPDFTLSVSGGEGDGTVTVTVERNESLSARTAVISFYYADESEPQVEVTVEQSAASPYIQIQNELPATIPASGGSWTATVTSNVDWYFTDQSTGTTMTASPTGGTSGRTEVTLTIAATEPSTSVTSTTVQGLFQREGGSPRVTVTREQDVESPSITTVDDLPHLQEYPIPVSGGTYSITVSSNVNWTATSAMLSLSPSTGTPGVTVVTVTATELPAPTEEGTTGETVTITADDFPDTQAIIQTWQATPEAYLTLSSDIPQSVPSGGGDYIITVSANTSWHAVNSFFSSTLTPASGESGETHILFHVPENQQHAVLGGQIDFYGLFGTHERLDVSQEAAPQPVPTTKYVRDLIEEGYAEVVSGCTGDYIEILPSCPYDMEEILDLEEVANGSKVVTANNNIIVWDRGLPSGWTSQAVADLYSGHTQTVPPRGHQFWDIGEIDSFYLAYNHVEWNFCAYPWSPGTSACPAETNGLFAPRYNANLENYYAQMGWRNTPKSVTIQTGLYTSVSQVMFTQMRTTTAITLNIGRSEWDYWSCHDGAGMFEGCHNLQTLEINGQMRWDSYRNINNCFQACRKLKSVPYSRGWYNNWTRDDQHNEIFAYYNGTRGNSNMCYFLDDCFELEYFGPVINCAALSLSGCTYDGYGQRALSDTMFETPKLTDVRLKNMGWNSWNFTDNSTYTYIPLMDTASIEYLLNNVQDVTGLGYTLTFNDLHENEVDSAAVQHAESLGWTIVWASVI